MRLLLISVLVICGLQGFSQIKFGAKAGVLFTNAAFNYDDNDLEPASKMKVGYTIGPAVEYSFTDNLALQTGLFWATKGYATDLEDDLPEGVSIDGWDRSTLNYLEIPITFAYKIKDFQVFAGPYLAYCLGGKEKWDYTTTVEVMGQSVSTDYKDDMKIKSFMGKVKEGDLDANEAPVSALDYGLNLGVGYQAGPVLINLGYSLGLGNLMPDMDVEGFDRGDFKSSNRVISLTASYYLGK